MCSADRCGTSSWLMSSIVPDRRGSLMSCILQACSRLCLSLRFCSSLVSMAVTSFCSCVNSLTEQTQITMSGHPIASQTSADVLQVILLVGTSQFLPDLLHLMVFIVHLRLLGQVLVFEILQLCHGLIYDLHVPLLFLLKQIKLSERALWHDHGISMLSPSSISQSHSRLSSPSAPTWWPSLGLPLAGSSHSPAGWPDVSSESQIRG